MNEKSPIRALCEKYKLTPTALANRFGIPARTVQQWYAGDRKPPDYVVAMIQHGLEKEG